MRFTRYLGAQPWPSAARQHTLPAALAAFTCHVTRTPPPARLAAFMLVLTCTFVAFLQPIFIAFNYTITTSHSTAVIDLFAGAFFCFDLLVNFRTGSAAFLLPFTPSVGTRCLRSTCYSAC